MQRIDFVTLFPEMVLPAARHSILKRAEEQRRVVFHAVSPRDFATDVHKTVDDKPFGGGPGMVLRPDVIASAIRCCIQEGVEPAIILAEPWGELFQQKHAEELSQQPHLIFVCGHYEGIDGRIADIFRPRIFSLGDFILTGGELPALTMADAIVRLLPGVLGSSESLEIDSMNDQLLSGPQFTRPWEFEGHEPPDVLRTGDHAAISRWKRQTALQLTRKMRPDLFAQVPLEKKDLDLI